MRISPKTVCRIAAVTCVPLLLACSAKQEPQAVSVTRYVAIDQPAPVPPGVVRYCWEEPIVQFERNGPGLDLEGNWYHPFYIAVREVRQGRWRPCEEMKSEVKGETKNER